MLTRIRTLVFTHHRRGLFGNRAHFERAVGAHIENGPHMQSADRSVRVPGAARAVLFKHARQAVGVFGQMLKRHRAILDEGHWFAVTLHRHHDVEARLAHLPEIALQKRIGDFNHAAGQPEFAHQFDKLFEFGHLLGLIFAGEFNQQNRCRLAFDTTVDDRTEGRIVTRQPDHGVVDQFNRRRIEFDDVLRRFHRAVKSREVANAQRLVPRQRRQIQMDTFRIRQRTLGTHQQMGHVERRGGH